MSLIIAITEEIRIHCPDASNYHVEKRRIVEKGKNAGQEQWDVLGFYGSIGGAAESLLRGHLSYVLGSVSKDVVTDLKAMALSVDEAADHIARACADAAPHLLKLARIASQKETNTQDEG